ncbi:hypothetical protein DFJ73DRAFT_800849 [Zopfochytrium polystomum]|nr:hypothetical protein DFJ73DRAFT_800849 [Zopfochytrium polystomum]
MSNLVGEYSDCGGGGGMVLGECCGGYGGGKVGAVAAVEAMVNLTLATDLRKGHPLRDDGGGEIAVLAGFCFSLVAVIYMSTPKSSELRSRNIEPRGRAPLSSRAAAVEAQARVFYEVVLRKGEAESAGL